MGREITSHRQTGNELNDHIRVETVDDPNPESKGHDIYQLHLKGPDGLWAKGRRIEFQKGPVKKIDSNTKQLIGIDCNGISMEALLAVCIDRLQCYQSGKYTCRENALALTHLETALLWLHKRTRVRTERGVEGTHEV
jgi:hypothetical protein